jgi:hypothetical protein
VVASPIVARPQKRTQTLVLLLLASCVPREAPDGTHPEQGPISASAVTLQRWRPHPAVHTKSDADPSGANNALQPDQSGTGDVMLSAPFHDAFERVDPGSDWSSTSESWRIQSGQLCGQSNRNHPIWLKRRIPINARISFVARSQSTNGDLKVEAWGNGRSFAKSVSYDDATSYIFIFGGWKNQLHVLARLNEHDEHRLELRIDRDNPDLRRQPVLPDVNYRFVIERTDGRTLVWRINDSELFAFEDKEPLRGQQHDHFGFNNWESPVCFDDLTIIPLPE